jgi:hypothetical protein
MSVQIIPVEVDYRTGLLAIADQGDEEGGDQ